MLIKTKILGRAGLWHHFPVIMSGCAVLTVIAYLLVVNNTNTMGIEIAEMQLKINRLKDINTDLNNESTQLKAMSRIESISKNQLSMVASETYQYLDSSDKPLAVRP